MSDKPDLYNDGILLKKLIQPAKITRTELEEISSTLRNKRRSWTTLFYVIVMIFLMACIIVLLSIHQPTQRYLDTFSKRHSYNVLRWARIMTAPITKHLNLREWYLDDCLVSNPWYEGFAPDCSLCSNVQRVIPGNKRTMLHFFTTYYNLGTPILFKDAVDSSVTFSDLQSFYNIGDNSAQLSDGAHTLRSTHPSITGSSLHSLFMINAHQIKDNVHVHWKTDSLRSARLLRSLFRRPYFVPQESEVSLVKHVFIDGDNAEKFTLPDTQFSNIWYVQSSGQRRLTFTPRQPCVLCTQFDVHVYPRQIVYFNDEVWQVESHPVLCGEVSVAFYCGFY